VRIIGLTGSIGMGKSTTAAMFRAKGVPVHDADAAVHRLYRSDAVVEIENAFPGIVTGGIVDRSALAGKVVGDDEALARLEGIVHPRVRKSEENFLSRSRAAGRRLVLLDIPLLLESGAQSRVDLIVVVTADAKTQRSRVLARPGMTAARFEALLARQTPDRQKRRRAHFLVDTSHGKETADRQVAAILRALAPVV
jgi:dephospho-CoA kinase